MTTPEIDVNPLLDPIAMRARGVLRAHRTGALSTLDCTTGGPFGSLVTVGLTVAGAPLMLLSDLALHTNNLKVDPRASLMVSEAAATGDPLALARVTMSGRLVVSPDPADRARFLARHPNATGYAAFADFNLYRLEPETVHLVAGFGVIETRPAAAIVIPPAMATGFQGAETDVVGHMNDDHADAVALYATRLLGEPHGDWRAVACDPDGCDLALGDRVVRLPFPKPAEAVGHLRHIFKSLSDQARGDG